MTHDQLDKAMELADRYRNLKVGEGTAQARAALRAYLLSTIKKTSTVAETPVDLYEARFKRLVAMEASLAPEDRIAYYVRNSHELDRLIKLDGLAKNVS